MKNLSTMSSTQLDNIKFILTDIDDTLTTEGRLKSDAYDAMERLSNKGYKVIPVNPFSVGKTINNEKVVEKLEDITDPIDIVNVFRPSNETPQIANQAVKIGTKILWLQYGIQNEEARKISELNNITYVANKCIKQEYQRLFLKMSPVFPALKTD